jgi:hypothetical protein
MAPIPQAMMTRPSILNKRKERGGVTDNNQPATVGQVSVHFDPEFQYITAPNDRPKAS